jgi:hypothetical protein
LASSSDDNDGGRGAYRYIPVDLSAASQAVAKEEEEVPSTSSVTSVPTDGALALWTASTDVNRTNVFGRATEALVKLDDPERHTFSTGTDRCS